MGRESSTCKRLDPVLGVIFFFGAQVGAADDGTFIMKLNTGRPCRSMYPSFYSWAVMDLQDIIRRMVSFVSRWNSSPELHQETVKCLPGYPLKHIPDKPSGNQSPLIFLVHAQDVVVPRSSYLGSGLGTRS